MNVFEDLVAELQEENLLETTFVDANRLENDDSDLRVAVPGSEYDLRNFAEPDDHSASRTSAKAEQESEAYTYIDAGAYDAEIDVLSLTENKSAGFRDDLNRSGYEVENEYLDHSAGAATVELASIDEQSAEIVSEPPPVPGKPQNGKEFYKKRAVGEISNLQMVEHVLTGVEREYMKIVPNVFDDLHAKKALHTFLRVTETENATIHAEAELALMTETEAWCSALARRDREIQVASLRQYCENSRPALSSQALLSLARFYRNLPYSESVRSKFDFVITRLFSRPTDVEKRVCLFTKDEMIGHINTLYKDWSSIALYNADDDESNILLGALSFDDLAAEAEKAVSFDQLIESDFFNRLRLFKESISEMFYAPTVAAGAIDANVRIGNAYVVLIGRAREKMDAESIQSKYGTLYDNSISDAAARTLSLVEILKVQPKPEIPEVEDEEYEVIEDDVVDLTAKPAELPVQFTEPTLPPFAQKLINNAKSINRGFLGIAIFLVLVSVGIYVWANFFVSENAPKMGVINFDVENSPLKGYAKTAKITGENCFVLMQPAWDGMPKERKTEILQKAYGASRDRGCTQVSLISKDGKTTGFASATRLDVVMP